MSEDKSKPITTREFLSERDMRIFKMRQAGTSINEIGRRFGISNSVVAKAIQRQLEKMNKEGDDKMLLNDVFNDENFEEWN